MCYKYIGISSIITCMQKQGKFQLFLMDVVHNKSLIIMRMEFMWSFISVMDIYCIHHHHDRLLPIINWDLLCDGFILLSTVLWLTRYKILQKIICVYGYPLITIRIIFCAINISVLVQSLLVCKTISYCMYNLGIKWGHFFQSCWATEPVKIVSMI